MRSVKPLSINPVNMAHASGNISPRGMDDHMIVIGHKAIGGYPNIPQTGYILQKIDEQAIIISAFKNRFRSSPAVHYMIPGPFIGYP
jgi:hypothetical protein